jgi:hypothetical protein
VADYVACVHAQGAQLGSDKSQKLSAEAVEVVSMWPGVTFAEVFADSIPRDGSRGLRVASLAHVLASRRSARVRRISAKPRSSAEPCEPPHDPTVARTPWDTRKTFWDSLSCAHPRETPRLRLRHVEILDARDYYEGERPGLGRTFWSAADGMLAVSPPGAFGMQLPKS